MTTDADPDIHILDRERMLPEAFPSLCGKPHQTKYDELLFTVGLVRATCETCISVYYNRKGRSSS